MTNKFEELLKKYKPEIEAICKSFANNFAKYKVEYDDLYQEACLKLWQVSKIDSKEHLDIVVRNHLINYTNKWKRDPLSEAENIGLIEDYKF